MSEKRFNQENFNQQLIIAACAKLVTEDGYSARDVMELLDEMKGQLWGALVQIGEEK